MLSSVGSYQHQEMTQEMYGFDDYPNGGTFDKTLQVQTDFGNTPLHPTHRYQPYTALSHNSVTSDTGTSSPSESDSTTLYSSEPSPFSDYNEFVSNDDLNISVNELPARKEGVRMSLKISPKNDRRLKRIAKFHPEILMRMATGISKLNSANEDPNRISTLSATTECREEAFPIPPEERIPPNLIQPFSYQNQEGKEQNHETVGDYTGVPPEPVKTQSVVTKSAEKLTSRKVVNAEPVEPNLTKSNSIRAFGNGKSIVEETTASQNVDPEQSIVEKHPGIPAEPVLQKPNDMRSDSVQPSSQYGNHNLGAATEPVVPSKNPKSSACVDPFHDKDLTVRECFGAGEHVRTTSNEIIPKRVQQSLKYDTPEHSNLNELPGKASEPVAPIEKIDFTTSATPEDIELFPENWESSTKNSSQPITEKLSKGVNIDKKKDYVVAKPVASSSSLKSKPPPRRTVRINTKAKNFPPIHVPINKNVTLTEDQAHQGPMIVMNSLKSVIHKLPVGQVLHLTHQETQESIGRVFIKPKLTPKKAPLVVPKAAPKPIPIRISTHKHPFLVNTFRKAKKISFKKTVKLAKSVPDVGIDVEKLLELIKADTARKEQAEPKEAPIHQKPKSCSQCKREKARKEQEKNSEQPQATLRQAPMRESLQKHLRKKRANERKEQNKILEEQNRLEAAHRQANHVHTHQNPPQHATYSHVYPSKQASYEYHLISSQHQEMNGYNSEEYEQNYDYEDPLFETQETYSCNHVHQDFEIQQSPNDYQHSSRQLQPQKDFQTQENSLQELGQNDIYQDPYFETQRASTSKDLHAYRPNNAHQNPHVEAQQKYPPQRRRGIARKEHTQIWRREFEQNHIHQDSPFETPNEYQQVLEQHNPQETLDAYTPENYHQNHHGLAFETQEPQTYSQNHNSEDYETQQEYQQIWEQSQPHGVVQAELNVHSPQEYQQNHVYEEPLFETQRVYIQDNAYQDPNFDAQQVRIQQEEYQPKRKKGNVRQKQAKKQPQHLEALQPQDLNDYDYQDSHFEPQQTANEDMDTYTSHEIQQNHVYKDLPFETQRASISQNQQEYRQNIDYQNTHFEVQQVQKEYNPRRKRKRIERRDHQKISGQQKASQQQDDYKNPPLETQQAPTSQDHQAYMQNNDNNYPHFEAQKVPQNYDHQDHPLKAPQIPIEYQPVSEQPQQLKASHTAQQYQQDPIHQDPSFETHPAQQEHQPQRKQREAPQQQNFERNHVYQKPLVEASHAIVEKELQPFSQKHDYQDPVDQEPHPYLQKQVYQEPARNTNRDDDDDLTNLINELEQSDVPLYMQQTPECPQSREAVQPLELNTNTLQVFDQNHVNKNPPFETQQASTSKEHQANGQNNASHDPRFEAQQPQEALQTEENQQKHVHQDPSFETQQVPNEYQHNSEHTPQEYQQDHINQGEPFESQQEVPVEQEYQQHLEHHNCQDPHYEIQQDSSSNVDQQELEQHQEINTCTSQRFQQNDEDPHFETQQASTSQDHQANMQNNDYHDPHFEAQKVPQNYDHQDTPFETQQTPNDYQQVSEQSQQLTAPHTAQEYQQDHVRSDPCFEPQQAQQEHQPQRKQGEASRQQDHEQNHVHQEELFESQQEHQPYSPSHNYQDYEIQQGLKEYRQDLVQRQEMNTYSSQQFQQNQEDPSFETQQSTKENPHRLEMEPCTSEGVQQNHVYHDPLFETQQASTSKEHHVHIAYQDPHFEAQQVQEEYQPQRKRRKTRNMNHSHQNPPIEQEPHSYSQNHFYQDQHSSNEYRQILEQEVNVQQYQQDNAYPDPLLDSHQAPITQQPVQKKIVIVRKIRVMIPREQLEALQPHEMNAYAPQQYQHNHQIIKTHVEAQQVPIQQEYQPQKKKGRPRKRKGQIMEQQQEEDLQQNYVYQDPHFQAEHEPYAHNSEYQNPDFEVQNAPNEYQQDEDLPPSQTDHQYQQNHVYQGALTSQDQQAYMQNNDYQDSHFEDQQVQQEYPPQKKTRKARKPRKPVLKQQKSQEASQPQAKNVYTSQNYQDSTFGTQQTPDDQEPHPYSQEQDTHQIPVQQEADQPKKKKRKTRKRQEQVMEQPLQLEEPFQLEEFQENHTYQDPLLGTPNEDQRNWEQPNPENPEETFQHQELNVYSPEKYHQNHIYQDEPSEVQLDSVEQEPRPYSPNHNYQDSHFDAQQEAPAEQEYEPFLENHVYQDPVPYSNQIDDDHDLTNLLNELEQSDIPLYMQ